MPRLDQQAGYVVTVEGRVDEALVDWFGPVHVAAVEKGGQAVTTLSGFAADQAGLIGLLRHLHGLGVVLLSFERVERVACHTAESKGDTR